MLKIQYMSDLHQEFGEMSVPDRLGDVLVLAGDIHVGERAIGFINECAEVFPHVIYILGNHEYYGNDINSLPIKIRDEGLFLFKDDKEAHYELLSENVYFLDNESVDIEGVRFIGSTLWSEITDYCARYMNDFYRIRNNTRPFSAKDARDRHEEAVKFIKDSINDGMDNVVVTHHCPSIECIDTKRYGDSRMNTGYYTDILEQFKDTVDVWICGHTHSSFDFVEHGIRVVGNCRGYVGYDLNNDFCETKCVEV